MALVNEVASSTSSGGGSTSQPPKGVHKGGSGYATLYTCPAGRRFKGNITYTSTGMNEVARINDEGVYANTSNYYIEIEMAGGDVFKAGGGQMYLHGVEEDA